MAFSRTTKSTLWIMAIGLFLRLPPLALGVIAALVMTAGYFLQVNENQLAAARAQVLAEGPPAVVDITAFDRDVHANAANEVMVQAQPALDHAYRLTLEKNTGEDHVFMVPLVGPSSTSATDIMGIAYYTSPTDAFENITPQLLMQGSVGFGAVGAVTNYNGKLGRMGQWDDLTLQAFTDEGLQMPANPVIVWPYQEGRAVALAPRAPEDWTIFGLLSKVAGAIGLFALAKLVFRSQSAAPEDAFEAEMPATAPMMGTQAMYQPPADDEDYTVNGSGAGNRTQYEVEDAVIVPQRRGFGLRKMLIGIVGLAFVVMLGNVLFDLLQEGMAADQASVAAISTPQEALANTVADVVVPDADPNRHWTDIDVTPVVEWFVAKGVLAASGDMDALKLLAMIAGGVLIAPMMLWYFFRTRRAFAPKTTARFDAMGIN